MGLKKVVPAPDSKKDKPEKEKKKAVKDEPKVEPPVTEPVAPPVDPAKEKKQYAGVGLVGNHPEMLKFRGLIKMRGKMIGEEIILMLTAWNEKNKF